MNSRCVALIVILLGTYTPDIDARQADTSATRAIASSFSPPSGYSRVIVPESSFAFYLRNLPLKPAGSKVRMFDGRPKENQSAVAAVVDLPIGDKDLHQCADAVIRLRAEFLYGRQLFDRIHFNFTNGFRAEYRRWMSGERTVVNGSRTRWQRSGSPSNTRTDFWNYLETVFMYAGSLSLSRELQSVDTQQIAIGDVFIRGGTPGHAVIVVDLAENAATGKKVFLLAQSYMPAQEIHVLRNPPDDEIDPWYSAEFDGDLVTPEWIFTRSERKRFR